MKHKLSLVCLSASLSLLLGSFFFLPKHDNSKVEEEKCFNGIKAMPFDNYSSTDFLSEPEYSDTYSFNFQYMNIGDTWSNYRGEGVTVAVIDSGIDIYHEDFLKPEAKNVTITSDNVTQYSILDPKSCYVHDPSEGYYTSSVKTDVGILNAYDTDTYDSEYSEYYSHGTASAACIGAAINGAGGFGVGPKINLLIIRIDFYFTSLDVAIRYAANNGADVINMSLGAYAETFTDGYNEQQEGGEEVATALESAINYARSKDCVVVAAAGNEKTNHKSYPACNEGVVGVGALGRKSGTSAADFSNYNYTSDTPTGNNNVDVMAPGYVWTANVDVNNGPKTSGNLKDTTYYETQGTSFASPLTAGAIALARGKYPDLSESEIKERLFETAYDMGTTGWDYKYGYGRVDVKKLLEDSTLESISLSPSEKTISVGQTLNLTVNYNPSNASNKLVMFMSEDESVATVDEDTGVVTAVGVGTTRIGCLPDETGVEEAYMTVHVVESGSLSTTWTLVNNTSSLIAGNEYVFGVASANKVSGTLSGTYLQAIDCNNFDGTTISELPEGAETFILGGSSGSYTLKQTSNNNLLGYTTTTLYSGSGTTTWAIGFDGNSCSIRGETYYLSYNSGAPRWKTYTASQGSYELYMKDSSVSTKTLSSISVSSPKTSYFVNDTFVKPTVIAHYSDNSTKDVTNSAGFTGYNLSVAGTYTVSVSYSEGSKTVTTTYSITVSANTPTVSSVTVTPDNLELDLNGNTTYTLTAVVSGTYNPSQNVTWSSNNESVATVSSNGVVTALSVGSATITATSTYDTSKSGTCLLEVVDTTSSGQVDNSGYYRINSTTDLENGNYLIVYREGSLAFNGSLTSLDATKNTIAVSIDTSGSVEYIDGNQTINASSFAIAKSGSNYTIKSSSGYYIGQTSNANGMATSTTQAYSNSISFYGNDANIVSSSAYLRYNKTSDQARFRYYKSSSYTGQEPVQLFKYVEANRTLTSISVSYTGGDLLVNQQINQDNLVVTANYDNDTSKIVTNYTLSQTSFDTTGSKTITVTYTEGEVTKTATFNVNVVADTLQSITATVSKTYHPGETIQKSDITVKATYLSGEKTVTDFTFNDDGYQFKYEDTNSGSSIKTKQFSVSYGGLTKSFNVNVSRTAYIVPSSSTSTINGDQAASAGVSGTAASGAANYNNLVINGVTCSLTNAYVYTKSNVKYISFGTAVGEIHNTVALNKRISSLSISLAANSRTDGKLYLSQDGNNWVLYNNANTSETAYYFFKVAYETSSSLYSNFNISLGLSNNDTAVNVANYIMYEDTNNQCLTKLDIAIGYFNNLSSSEKETFRTSNDYVIKTARERLEAWATSKGQSISYNSNGSMNLANTYVETDSSNDTMMVMIISVISIISVSSLLVCVRKKRTINK